MSKRKILKGLKGMKVFPILTNTETEYKTGPGISVPGSQQLSLEPNVSEWQIDADDEIYEAGADWNGMSLSFQLAELPLELKSHFEGGTWNEQTKTYDYKSNSQAPEIGMSFAAATSDGEYRMVKLFRLKCTKVSGEYKSKSASGDNFTPITIEGKVMSRTIDSLAKREKDSVDADLTWLDSLSETTPPSGE